MLDIGLVAYDVIAPARSKCIASVLLAPLFILACSLFIATSTEMPPTRSHSYNETNAELPITSNYYYLKIEHYS